MAKSVENSIVVTEKFVRYDTTSVLGCLDEYFGGDYEIVDPRAERLVQTRPADWPAANAWFLTAQQDTRRWLVDMIITSETLLGNNSPGFCNWLHDFAPTNCNDWLAAPMLYRRFVSTGRISRQLHVPKGTFLQRVLAPTRGLLLWTSQVECLIEFALNTKASISTIDRLVRGYRRQNPDVLEELEQLKIDDLSLRTVFYHHTNGLQYFLGGPNHYISGFLSEHFDHVEFNGM